MSRTKETVTHTDQYMTAIMFPALVVVACVAGGLILAALAIGFGVGTVVSNG